MTKNYIIILKHNLIYKLFISSKVLAAWYLFHFFSFTNIFESKSKIYWCYGSFSLDNNIEYFLVSFCGASIPISFFVIFFFYLGNIKIKHNS